MYSELVPYSEAVEPVGLFPPVIRSWERGESAREHPPEPASPRSAERSAEAAQPPLPTGITEAPALAGADAPIPKRGKLAPKPRRSRETLQMPVAAPEPEAVRPRSALPRLVPGSRLISIRVPPISDVVTCELCSKPFSAEGPTGYYEERPICDRCLLEQNPQLGMLMILSIYVRTCSELAIEPGPTGTEATVEMLAFARIYELFSARYGPPRTLDFAPTAVVRSIF